MKKKKLSWLRVETDFGPLAAHPSVKTYIELLNRRVASNSERDRKYAPAKLWQVQSAINAIHEVAYGTGLPFEQCFKEIEKR